MIRNPCGCIAPRVLLGILGYLKWFTCRDCGMQFSRTVRKKQAPAKVGKPECDVLSIADVDANSPNVQV